MRNLSAFERAYIHRTVCEYQRGDWGPISDWPRDRVYETEIGGEVAREFGTGALGRQIAAAIADGVEARRQENR